MSATTTDRSAEKQERFKRIAEKRVNRVLEQIDLLANCADSSRYAYTDVQADTIVSALRDATDRVQAAFSQNGDAKARVTL